MIINKHNDNISIISIIPMMKGMVLNPPFLICEEEEEEDWDEVPFSKSFCSAPPQDSISVLFFGCGWTESREWKR